MKKREYRDYLQDMLNSLDDVVSFTKNMRFDSFSEDKKTVYAVIRCLEVMGEAAKKIPKSLRDKHPSLPWKEMAGMRDKAHEYFGVNLKTLWKTAKEELPPLRPLIQEMLESLNA